MARLTVSTSFARVTARVLCAVFLFSPAAARAEVNTSLWKTQKSQHFIIYSQEAPGEYTAKLADAAEKYYTSIIEKLGYRRFDFWSWDNRAKIFLYPDSASYLADNAGRAAWSGASVNIKSRTIKTFVGQDSFFDSILPHEMAHIIFREFVGSKKTLPLWLDEGVATVQEEGNLQATIQRAHNLVSQGFFIDLKELSEIKDYSLIVPQVFYAEACSLVNYLLEEYGRDKFLEFSRSLRDGQSWQEALEDVYKFRDLGEFEGKWKEYYSRR